MPFLTDADYKSQIKDAQLAILIEATGTIRTDAEMKAEAQIRSRIGVKYDAAASFATTGTARNAEIIMCYIDMVLYHLHSRITPGQVPELRKERYGDALTWLDKIARGTYAVDLPKVGDADGDGVDDKNEVQWGGRPANNPYF